MDRDSLAPSKKRHFDGRALNGASQIAPFNAPPRMALLRCYRAHPAHPAALHDAGSVLSCVNHRLSKAPGGRARVYATCHYFCLENPLLGPLNLSGCASQRAKSATPRSSVLKLRKVELLGFKSFCEKTNIVFSGGGVTCIVGPNGCGKSNVVDAISWVLGEQSHKMLRAERMSDCIFNGTAKRPPLGLAEVTLTLVDPELAEAVAKVIDGQQHGDDAPSDGDAAAVAIAGQPDRELSAGDAAADTTAGATSESDSVETGLASA